MSRYALIIGIGDYRQLDPLTRPRPDAQAVHDLLREHGNFDDIYALLDEKATGNELLRQLEYVLLEQGSGNEVLLYFTGHGLRRGGRSDRKRAIWPRTTAR